MFAFRSAVSAVFFFAAFCAPPSQRSDDAFEHRFQSALAHFNSGQYTAAQKELEALGTAQPSSFEAQELLGLVYSAQGQEEKATAEWSRFL